MLQSSLPPRRCQSDFDLIEFESLNTRSSDISFTKLKEKSKKSTLFSPTPIKEKSSHFQLQDRKIALNFTYLTRSEEKVKHKEIFLNPNSVSISTELNKKSIEITDEINSLIELREDSQNPQEKDEFFQTYLSMKDIKIEPFVDLFDFDSQN